VHAGRILTDGTRLAPWLDALEARARNAAAANRSPASSPTSPSFPTRTSTSSRQTGARSASDTWIHCSIGPEGEDIEEDERQQTQITPLAGFDRLALVGLSPEDIESMRRQFRVQHPETADGGM
jgi:hypothetical protein